MNAFSDRDNMIGKCHRWNKDGIRSKSMFAFALSRRITWLVVDKKRTFVSLADGILKQRFDWARSWGLRNVFVIFFCCCKDFQVRDFATRPQLLRQICARNLVIYHTLFLLFNALKSPAILPYRSLDRFNFLTRFQNHSDLKLNMYYW